MSSRRTSAVAVATALATRASASAASAAVTPGGNDVVDAARRSATRMRYRGDGGAGDDVLLNGERVRDE